jgi:uncharacterized protein (TIGR00296 family)
MYQPEILTDKEGRELLKIARTTFESFVKKGKAAKPKTYSDKFQDACGVICTVFKNTGKGQAVLGNSCSGLPYPLLSLIDAVLHVVSDIHEHSKASPVSESDLSSAVIELSVITEPRIIMANSARQLFDNIAQGTDGIVMVYGVYESYLPPQAWSEIKDKEEFLNQLCLKAGLTKDMWKEPAVRFYKFQAQIFREENRK